MMRNKHKVPQSQWRKWKPVEQAMFNNLFETVLDQRTFNAHPKSTLLTEACWRTVAWNVAWQAADQLRYRRKLEIDVVNERGYRAPTKRAA